MGGGILLLLLLLFFVFLFPRVHHSTNPIRIRNKTQRPIEPQNPGLRVQRNVTDPFTQELFHQPLHHRLAQPDPLERRVNHHVPDDGVEHAVPCGPREGHRPLRLPVLHPQQRVGVLQRDPDLFGVPLREPDRHEH